ncbi:hypothetical protein C8J57DRAFT_24870 [Mycena rebaudengoi]|nr:hypothetical protein C8J57DRAFT_24870 [Mycena rebaudengoi]
MMLTVMPSSTYDTLRSPHRTLIILPHFQSNRVIIPAIQRPKIIRKHMEALKRNRSEIDRAFLKLHSSSQSHRMTMVLFRDATVRSPDSIPQSILVSCNRWSGFVNYTCRMSSPNPSQLVPEGYSQYDPQYPAETAPLQRHAPSDEHDRWRPASLPPGAATSAVLAQRPVSHQPSHFPHDAVAPLGGQQQLGRSPYQQQQVLQGPDPRRRQSAQAHPPPVDLRQQELQMVNDLRQPNSPPSFEPSISSVNPRRPQPQHVPKHLVMPTPLQQNPRSSQQQPHTQAYRASPPPVQHYAPTPQVKSQALPSQPVRAQTIQMAPEGGRQVLRKRASVVKAPSLPMPPPTRPGATRPLSYMEPPPTVPQTPIPQPTVQNKRRPKRLLSKKRTDL